MSRLLLKSVLSLATVLTVSTFGVKESKAGRCASCVASNVAVVQQFAVPSAVVVQQVPIVQTFQVQQVQKIRVRRAPVIQQRIIVRNQFRGVRSFRGRRGCF